MKEETKIIELDKLVFEPTLYPRTKSDWLTAYKYSQAMAAGNVFPPILVGLLNNRYIVVDGVHRLCGIL
jgi:hypothetical protein